MTKQEKDSRTGFCAQHGVVLFGDMSLGLA